MAKLRTTPAVSSPDAPPSGGKGPRQRRKLPDPQDPYQGRPKPRACPVCHRVTRPRFPCEVRRHEATRGHRAAARVHEVYEAMPRCVVLSFAVSR